MEEFGNVDEMLGVPREEGDGDSMMTRTEDLGSETQFSFQLRKLETSRFSF